MVIQMDNAIADFLMYLRARGDSKHTIRAYGSDLFQLVNFCSDNFDLNNISLINRNIIRKFIGSLYEKSNSFSTMSRKISVIKSFFEYCKISGFITEDPALKLIYPKTPKPLPKHFTFDEMRQLLHLADTKTNLGIRDQAMLELLYATGMRIGELEKVEVKHYDPERTLVKIIGKGRKERLNPVGSYAIRAINKYLKIRPKFSPKDENLFLSKSGKCLKADCIRQILHKYIVQVAKVPGYSVHSIRHSFATHLLDNGCNLRALQIMMGHENVSTTQLYVHLSLSSLRKVYDKAFAFAFKRDHQIMLDFAEDCYA